MLKRRQCDLLSTRTSYARRAHEGWAVAVLRWSHLVSPERRHCFFSSNQSLLRWRALPPSIPSHTNILGTAVTQEVSILQLEFGILIYSSTFNGISSLCNSLVLTKTLRQAFFRQLRHSKAYRLRHPLSSRQLPKSFSSLQSLHTKIFWQQAAWAPGCKKSLDSTADCTYSLSRRRCVSSSNLTTVLCDVFCPFFLKSLPNYTDWVKRIRVFVVSKNHGSVSGATLLSPCTKLLSSSARCQTVPQSKKQLYR